jgi:hypothetical protein
MLLKGMQKATHGAGWALSEAESLLRLSLFHFFLGWGGGGVCNPGWAQGVPLQPCIGGEQRFWKRPSVVASPRCYPTRCMGLRMFVTNSLQNRPRLDRSRRTARGTLAS